MGKKNRKGNREPKKPKAAKLQPQQSATTVAELGRRQALTAGNARK